MDQMIREVKAAANRGVACPYFENLQQMKWVANNLDMNDPSSIAVGEIGVERSGVSIGPGAPVGDEPDSIRKEP